MEDAYNMLDIMKYVLFHSLEVAFSVLCFDLVAKQAFKIAHLRANVYRIFKKKTECRLFLSE